MVTSDSGISIEIFISIGLNIFLFLLLLIISLANKSSIKKLKKKYERFMTGFENKSMEGMLEEVSQKLDDMKEKNKEIEQHLNFLDRNLINCIQKIGIVRYNAFDNVGSNLSFSVALLDNMDNGVVISGIYARDSSSTYAKPIISGKSKYSLSGEEIQAIEIAKKSKLENSYIK